MTVHEAAARGFQRVPEAYERGRPEYPAEAVRHLVGGLGISPTRVVLDLGAGTGKLTRLLVPTGARIVAVEPVTAMRESLVRSLPEIEAREGTAEAIPLADGSVDAVVVAQAFHWFEGGTALSEIHRVLRPGGRLGLLWNIMEESSPWLGELTRLLRAQEGGVPRYATGEWRRAFERTSLFSPLELAQFRYVQRASLEQMLDRVNSISFVAAMPPEPREGVLRQVRAILERALASTSVLELPHRVDVYVCARVRSPRG